MKKHEVLLALYDISHNFGLGQIKLSPRISLYQDVRKVVQVRPGFKSVFQHIPRGLRLGEQPVLSQLRAHKN